MVLEEELRRVADKIDKATTVAEVLGPDDAGRKKRERDLLRKLHPDVWTAIGSATTISLASHAFAKLQQLIAIEAKRGSTTFEVATKKRTYRVDGLAYTGTVANLYHCRYERDGDTKTGLLKLPRSVRDNDLVQTEAQALKKIWATGKKRTAFFPRLEDSFKHRDKTTRKERFALVTRRLDGFITLADVKKAYPGGLDARDLAWIWRRCLAATSLLSEVEIVHGSLTPEHILIHPAEHGVQFCGFTSSVTAGNPLKIMSGSKWLFPPEVFAKEPADHTTDLFMLHKTMRYMLHNDSPRQFYAFINGVCFDRQAVRPQDSRALLGEYDSLLARLYGARKFRVFPPMKE